MKYYIQTELRHRLTNKPYYISKGNRLIANMEYLMQFNNRSEAQEYMEENFHWISRYNILETAE